MSIVQYVALAAAVAVLAVPASQAIWIPFTHLKFVLYHHRKGLELPALGFAGTLAYYWRALIANLVMAWWMLRALGRNGLRQPAGQATGPPVLCVHGFLRNGTCMWGLRRALERRGRPTRAVSMGLPFRSIDRCAPPLAAALRELVDRYPGQKIDAVAHSMGGVVLRLVLAQHPRLAAAIGHIVTLGTPHRGTAAVRDVLLSPEGRQLARGSRFIERLPDLSQSVPRAEVTTIAAALDFIVYPKSTSHPPGGRAVDFPRPSHPGLITDPEVVEYVAKLIAPA